MAYSVKGNLSEDARVIVIDETTGSIENAFAFSAGEWELITPDNNQKIVLARKTGTGETYGYSRVLPAVYVMSLAIDSSGNKLAINDSEDTLVVSF